MWRAQVMGVSKKRRIFVYLIVAASLLLLTSRLQLKIQDSRAPSTDEILPIVTDYQGFGREYITSNSSERPMVTVKIKRIETAKNTISAVGSWENISPTSRLSSSAPSLSSPRPASTSPSSSLPPPPSSSSSPSSPPRTEIHWNLSHPYKIPEIHVKTINCPALFVGKADERVKAAKIMADNHSPDNYLSETQLVDLAEDCKSYKAYRQYIESPLTPEEAEFPIAYSIMMYKNAGMTERLLRAIYRPQNYYCIHIDRKAPQSLISAMEKVANCFSNVFLAKNSASVTWGFFGVLEAELICMKQLLIYSWKYFINLTGEEFPLRTNWEIVRALKMYNGSNDISNLYSKHVSDRWLISHSPEGTVSHVKKPPPHGIVIHKGDAHVTLVRGFVEFIFKDPRVQDFLEWLKDAFCPEEFFFSSLQYNTFFHAPGGYEGEIDFYTNTVVSRHKKWVFEGVHCGGMWQRYICIYGVTDLVRLHFDRSAFFVNKLSRDFEPLTLDCLEERIFKRTKLFYDKDEAEMKNQYQYNRSYFVQKRQST